MSACVARLDPLTERKDGGGFQKAIAAGQSRSQTGHHRAEEMK